MLAISRAADAPSVFWVSGPFKAGDCALVYGANLKGATVSFKGKVAASSKVLDTGSNALKVELTSSETYPTGKLTISTPGGSVDAYVNRPEVWWAQDDLGQAVTAGSKLRIFGRALNTPGGTAKVTLTSGNQVTTLDPVRSNLYEMDVTLPSTLKSGHLNLQVQRGDLVSAGYDLTVEKPTPGPSGNVSAGQFGAKGDGTQDDGGAIQAGLDAAAQSHKRLVLAPGCYRIGQPLSIKSGAELAGADEGSTFLLFDTPTPPASLIEMDDQTRLSNLTLLGTQYRNGVTGTKGGVTLSQVRFRLNPYAGHVSPAKLRDFVAAQDTQLQRQTAVVLSGPNVAILDCDIDAGGRALNLNGTPDSVVRNTRLVNGRWGWYSLSGSDGLIFENNTIIGGDLMATGGGINTLGASPVSQNVFYGHNQISRCLGGDREALTLDGPGGGFAGDGVTVNGRDLNLPTPLKGDPSKWVGAGAYIVEGPGKGQVRQITAASMSSVTVDNNWDVPPTRDSIISVAPLRRQYLLIDNHVEDAGIAIQVYGSSVNVIAANNTSLRTLGFANVGLKFPGGLQPTWYIQWLDNKVAEPMVMDVEKDGEQRVTYGGISVITPAIKNPSAPLGLGIIIRGNTVEGNGTIDIGWRGRATANDNAAEDIVVENNSVSGAAVGLRMNPNSRRVLQRNNRFVGCATSVDDRQGKN